MSIFPGPQPGGGTGGSTEVGAPTQHGRYSNALKGSTNTNIVQFPSAIGTPSTADFTHNADYATVGSVFTCVSSGWFNIDLVLITTEAGKGINVIQNSAVSNDVDNGTVIAAESSAGANYVNSTSTIRYVAAGEVIYVALGGSAVVADATTNNIEYNRILITRVTGPGATGPQGPTGPAGAGAITPAYMRYTGVSGRGSTNTTVCRFVTAQESVGGADLSFTDSASLGSYFTANTSGVYAVSATIYTTAGSSAMWIAVGNTVVNIFANTEPEIRLALSVPAGAGSSAWTGYVAAGQKIWVASFVAVDNSVPLVNQVTVARVN